MKCIILAAGYATRLYPLTLNKPKPLLMIGKKPMMEHILDKIKLVDEIDEIFIVTNNKFFSVFEEWKNNLNFDKKVKIINDGTLTNEDRLGAVGDMAFVIEKEDINDDLMIIGGDNLFEFSLAVLNEISNKNNASVIAIYDLIEKQKLAKKFGVVEVDENNKIIGFEEKPENPKTSFAATLCYIFKKHDLVLFKDFITSKDRPDNIGEVIRYLVNKTNVYAMISSEKWWDIGNKEQLEEVNKIFQEKS